MSETIYIIRTADYDSVEEALDDGAVYTFEISTPMTVKLTNDVINCMFYTSICINCDDSKVQGYVKKDGEYITLERYMPILDNELAQVDMVATVTKKIRHSNQFTLAEKNYLLNLIDG